MMSAEPFARGPKNRVPVILGYVAVAVVMFGAGMLVQARLAAKTAATAQAAHEQELKQAAQELNQANEKAEEQKRMFNDTLTKEREDHAKDVQAKDKSLAVAGNRAAGMRHALEADLSAARASGEACTSRIDGISEALNGVFDSVGEVAGLAQDLGRENRQLKEDNKLLSEKLAGWQKWSAERSQRVTVVGEKKG